MRRLPKGLRIPCPTTPQTQALPSELFPRRNLSINNTSLSRGSVASTQATRRLVADTSLWSVTAVRTSCLRHAEKKIGRQHLARTRGRYQTISPATDWR